MATLIVRVIKPLIYVAIVLSLLSGCTAKDECAQAVAANVASKNKDFQLSAAACRKDYQQTQRKASLLSLTTSLGELSDWTALDALYADVTQPLLQADAMIIGAKYRRQNGQAEAAHQDNLSAINIYREFEQSDQLGRALYQAFKFAWRHSDHRAALRFAGEALQVARLAGNKNHEISALSNLVKVFQEVGSIGAAQHALDLQRPLLIEHANLGQRIDAHINQGLVYVDAERYGLAVFSFEKALAAAANSGNGAALRGLHLNLVSSNIELGRFEEAETHLKRAWAYANSDGTEQYALNYFQSILQHKTQQFELADKSIHRALADSSIPAVWDWELLYQAGRIAQDLGDRRRASNYFNDSIIASDSLRGAIGFNDLKAHLLSRKREPYEALFLNYLQEGKVEAAFYLAEQAKSKSFIEAYLHNQEQAVFENQDTGTTALNVVAESRRIDDLLHHLETQQSSPVSTAHSAQELLTTLDKDQIISLFVAQQRVFVINLSAGAITIDEAELSYSTLRDLVHDYKARPSNEQILTRLGATLLSNFDANHPSEHLYISPDDLFSDVAFASLRVSNKFIVELKSVSLVPSASALFEIQANAGVLDHKNAFSDALVVGNPNNDLPSAQMELMAVAKRLETHPITGGSALSTLLMRSLNSHILHLATHSGVNQLGPWVRFADGDVPAKQIAPRGVVTKLAVLASCSSAASDGKNVWGSLGGLFLSSGTANVVVTQWSVKDDVTLEVLSDFYAHLVGGESAAESLALVQRKAIINNTQVSEWAAYALLGK